MKFVGLHVWSHELFSNTSNRSNLFLPSSPFLNCGVFSPIYLFIYFLVFSFSEEQLVVIRYHSAHCNEHPISVMTPRSYSKQTKG